MRIAIGSDHAGKALRDRIAEHLREAGREVLDFGTETTESVDYPHYAGLVAESVTGGDADRGVLVCGTGVGVSIAANKVSGIRAAACASEFTARAARAHNNANILCLGERVLGVGVALGILDVFLATEFEGGRHTRRVDQIALMESERQSR